MPKSKAPELTYEENKYLQHLADDAVPICVRLTSNEEIHGVIEFFDASFLRLNRQEGPNLFVYKDHIKYLYEESPNA